LTEGTRGFRFKRDLTDCIKSVAWINSRKLLLATRWGAGIFDLKTFRFTDTLFRERTTVAFYKNDTMYIGTLNGLYRSVKRSSFEFLGDKTPFLKKRIASIVQSEDETLWIASGDDAGIIGYKNNRQVVAIGRQQGLTSDICRTLLVHNNNLWVGTDKGLNRIELSKPGYHITQYTSKDGLVSDMVNTLFADSSRIYVGTAAGLSFFDEKKIVQSEECRLYLVSLINSDKDRIADTGRFVIPYTNKRVRFEFACISYRSASDITYRYRIAGLDDTWRETKENYLEYPDLPSGNYEWQLMAINKFGKQSRLLKVPVEVTIQFWKKTWFVIGVWLLSLVLLWGLVSYRIARIRRRQQEKDGLMQAMSELENTALKAQMNPHFIFNCLNSIQQYILIGHTDQADKYIAGLAKLIRITLNNSSRSYVCISDDIDYLLTYLSLEKMRFKEKIHYELEVSSDIDQQTVLIPPMLIQPFVENALHHGLQHKANGPGFINIKLKKDKDMLLVTVEDNGIGRTAATAKKSAGGAAYPSKGMSLIMDRIAIINKLYKTPATIQIIDLKDNTDTPMGTRIEMRLPLMYEQDLFT
jgi:hypothetical protein